ncbi:hypothetical protein E4U40_001512 [Claviceps sp. LM458 group G5]|nr:hypothetical protein E4U40_001512 [Claviceps sp. LM458 group G5]
MSSAMPSSPDQDPATDPKDPFSNDIKRKFQTYASLLPSSSLFRSAHDDKSHSKFVDPCQEASQRSYKCLFRNDGDKSMCSDYFQYVVLRFCARPLV